MSELLSFYTGLSAILFSLGILGVLLRRNVLIILMSIELMLNAVNLLFVAASRHFLALDGQIYSFFVVTVAAAEACVGLAILIAMFRHCYSVESQEMSELRH